MDTYNAELVKIDSLAGAGHLGNYAAVSTGKYVDDDIALLSHAVCPLNPE